MLFLLHNTAAETANKETYPSRDRWIFFAEMVKTDDHMARVKDRLIFETKKMDAVSQRKSNKEHKLRAKEAHANKVAEKARRKKEHFTSIQEWKEENADSNNERRLPNKKREAANRKFGFGGKRGRFKQNSKESMNDMTDYNPRGNFSGGRKAVPKKRPGKRARDSARSRR
uniref:rRNA-processing protein EBP2 n=1 Tax=Grammatophora oceanica TaxID=210454 RepID=A0A7S1VRU7_9STRA|mmetsp:Transcript_52482/g.78411  ORF Transcript_52482/g.78411 Transcript_52482/m.78411 type:complete len:171 (+) Transcript_52482:42-554(+)